MTDRIREIIQQDPAEQVEEVEYDGQKYVVKGFPDASVLADRIVLSKENIEKRATHYTAMCGNRRVSKKTVLSILAIHNTLQPPPGAERYQETEIAKLSQRDSGLFFTLAKAAMKVLGMSALVDETKEEIELPDLPITQLALGNSEGQGSSGSSSSDSADSQ